MEAHLLACDSMQTCWYWPDLSEAFCTQLDPSLLQVYQWHMCSLDVCQTVCHPSYHVSHSQAVRKAGLTAVVTRPLMLPTPSERLHAYLPASLAASSLICTGPQQA